MSNPDIIAEWASVKLPPVPEVKPVTVDPKTTLEAIRAVVREDGMRTLYEEGAMAVVTGQTTVEEMMRVCTLEE